jgi:hypothetical protein
MDQVRVVLDMKDGLHSSAGSSSSSRGPQNCEYTNHKDQFPRSTRQRTTGPICVGINSDSAAAAAPIAGLINPGTMRSKMPLSCSTTRMLLLWTIVLAVFHLGPNTTQAESTESNQSSAEDDGTISISYDDDNNEQIKLGPMRLCLFPTPISLPASDLEDDIRKSLLELVTHTLKYEWSYSNVFEYFEFTDATIEWFSGEQQNTNETTTATTATTKSTPADDDIPCGVLQNLSAVVPFTQLSYEGVVLLLSQREGSNYTMPAILDIESFISSVIEGGLVQSLHNLVITESSNYDTEKIGTTNLTALLPYFEIQVASVSFGGGDDDDDSDENDDVELPGIPPLVGGTPQTTPTTIPTDPPSTLPIVDPSPPFDMDSSSTDSPTTSDVVAGLESSTSSSVGSGNNTSTGRTVGIAIGSLLVVVALLTLFVHRRRKNNEMHQSQDDSNPHVSNPQLTLDGQDSPNFIGSTRSSRRHWTADVETSGKSYGYGGSGSCGTSGGEDASEMAHYSTSSQYQKQAAAGGDSRSVASEWTLGTSDDTSSVANRSTMTGNTPRLLRAAELRASTEAFERDRQITLQKDMLQSEWSSAVPVVTPPKLMIAGGGSGLGGTATTNSSSATGGGSSLSFEQAYDRGGQGEEIYLMPPRPLRRSRSPRGGPAIV